MDTHALINQTDIIYNCTELKNILILQSSIEKLKNYNPNAASDRPQKKSNTNISKYNAFKTFVESLETSDDRHFFVLPDIYHRGIREGLSSSGSAIAEEYSLLQKCIEWYQRHVSDIGFKEISFKLLTSNAEMMEFKKE